jgi:hypothetical protein
LRLALPHVELLDTVSSTQDVARQLAAADAPAELWFSERANERARPTRPSVDLEPGRRRVAHVGRAPPIASADVLSLRVGLAWRAPSTNSRPARPST